jgi:hypothetical protein
MEENMSVKLSNMQWGIVGLTAVTAIIHLVLGVGSLPDMFGIIFILNGLGYLALVAGLYFLPQMAAQRSMIRWALMGFTAVTFILYFIFNLPNSISPFGLFDKAVELALIVLLWMEK